MQYQETKPATLTGIEKYLGSGLIKGVGPVTAKRIVKHFGLDTLDIIEHQIDRLSEVTGIAQKRIAMIQRTWAEQKSIKDVMIFLQSHGVWGLSSNCTENHAKAVSLTVYSFQPSKILNQYKNTYQ